MSDLDDLETQVQGVQESLGGLQGKLVEALASQWSLAAYQARVQLTIELLRKHDGALRTDQLHLFARDAHMTITALETAMTEDE